VPIRHFSKRRQRAYPKAPAHDGIRDRAHLATCAARVTPTSAPRADTRCLYRRSSAPYSEILPIFLFAPVAMAFMPPPPALDCTGGLRIIAWHYLPGDGAAARCTQRQFWPLALLEPIYNERAGTTWFSRASDFPRLLGLSPTASSNDPVIGLPHAAYHHLSMHDPQPPPFHHP